MKTLLLAFLVLASLAAQTMSIEEYDPKSTLVVPEHPVQTRQVSVHRRA